MKLKWLCIFFISITSMYAEESLSQLADLAERQFQDNKFVEAEKTYLEILENYNFKTPRIYYNLGSCYYHQKNYLMAKWAFLKAASQSPFNARITQNLMLIDQALDISGKPIKEPFLKRIFIWYNIFSPILWFIILVLLLFLLSFLLIAWLYKKKYPYLILIISLALLLPISSFSALYSSSSNKDALITGIVTLQSGNGDFYQQKDELSPLKTGEKIRILQSRTDWVEIMTSDGEKGWVPQQSVLIID